MKRLVFLTPDVARAKAVVARLESDGIEKGHIYTVARKGAALEGLPDAGPEDNDFIPAFKRGVLIGGILGLILGLLISFFPPLGLPVGIDVILLVGIAGASIGGLGTGLMGSAFPNTRLKPFAKEIKAGKIAVIADVPPDRVSHVNGMIRQLDPEVDIEGIEPRANIIPKK